jgi:hypothetical protein
MPDDMSNNCLEIEMFSTSIQVYTKLITKSVAMTFVQPQSKTITNIYSVVKNRHGVIVGQIMSDILTLNVTVLPKSNNTNPFQSMIFMDICVYCNAVTCGGIEDFEVDPRYNVYDLGSAIKDDDYFEPMNATLMSTSSGSLMCFQSVRMKQQLVLILRMSSYQNIRLVTVRQEVILFTTFGLYGLAVLIIAFQLFAVLWMQVFIGFQTKIIWLIQSMLLMMTRSVYFFLIAWNAKMIGSMTDYVLVEIPTFFYLSILVQILISSMNILRQQSSVTQSQTWKLYGLCWLVVWLAFAGVIIGISFVDNSGHSTYNCACRLQDFDQPSNVTRYIFELDTKALS